MAMSTGKVVALIQAMGGADPAVIESAVQDWLDAHPEATTTVQDGSITEQKLATTVAQKLGLISSLSDEIGDLKSALLNPTYTITAGKYVNKNTGAFTENTTGSPSAISNIPVMPGDTLTLVIDGLVYGGNRGYAFYNANGGYISGGGYTQSQGTQTISITVPSGAVTMALTAFAYSTYTLTGNTEVNSIVKHLNDVNQTAQNGFFQNGIQLSALKKTESCFINGTTGQAAEHSDYDCYKMAIYPGITVTLTPGFTHNTAGYALLNTEGAVVRCFTYANDGSYSITAGQTEYYLQFTARKNITPSVGALNTATDVYLSVSQATRESATNPLAKMDYAPSFITMFRKIACIGDSLTAGAFNTTSPSESGVVIGDFSYPAMLKKMTSVDVYNLGAGGSVAAHVSDDIDTDRSWWAFMEAGIRFPTADFTNNPCDAYIIALGTNDILKFGSFTGTVDASGVADPTTSVGGYCEIIDAIKQYQPKAKIFLVTISRYRNTAETRAVANAKIKAIAEYYDNCYVVDTETYDVGDFDPAYKNGSHNNALGYNLRARQMISYIDWIIANNLDDFQNVQFIGTNYDYED